jgi:hypothetical protein
VYSGKRVPFSPADFLYHWWLSDEGLAGYQQHDAHEFFLSLLDKLEGGSMLGGGAGGGGGGAAGAPPPPRLGARRASPPPLLLPPAAAGGRGSGGGGSPAPEDSDAAAAAACGRGSSWRDDDDGGSTDSGYLGTGGRPSPAVYGARAWADPFEATPEPDGGLNSGAGRGWVGRGREGACQGNGVAVCSPRHALTRPCPESPRPPPRPQTRRARRACRSCPRSSSASCAPT